MSCREGTAAQSSTFSTRKYRNTRYTLRIFNLSRRLLTDYIAHHVGSLSISGVRLSSCKLQIGWLITGCFTLVSMITSFWLMNKHCQWYTNVGTIIQRTSSRYLTPREERGTEMYACHLYRTLESLTLFRTDIIRILLMVPLYALVSFASYLFWVRS